MAHGPAPLNIVADIGGTNARFALCGPGGTLREEAILACKDYPDPVAAVETYLSDAKPERRPERGAFAVASPVLGDTVDMTNHPWKFSIEDVRKRLNLDCLAVINDFTAIALAIPHLREADRVAVGSGEAAPGTPIAVLGPGTGLGVSGLIPNGPDWIPLATEGGHVTLAAFTDRESAILDVLRRDGHVSAEDALSGPGLVNLYKALCRIEGIAPETPITPAGVTDRAQTGTCPICREALDTFCAMLGTVAADLCLTLGARGGVYIAGGIVPKLGRAFTESHFRARFQSKGRFSDYLAAVPTFVITHPLPAFIGLTARLRSNAR